MTANDGASNGRMAWHGASWRRTSGTRGIRTLLFGGTVVVLLAGNVAHGEDGVAVDTRADGASGESIAEAGQAEGFSQSVGPEVATFDPTDTDLLLSVGWQAPAADIDDGFDDHAARLRTLIAIATTLGLDPEVGAMQANCGTPQEHGLGETVALRAELVAAQAEGAAALEALANHLTDAEIVLDAVRRSAGSLPEGESSEETIAALEVELVSTSSRIATLEAEQAARQAEIAALEETIRAGLAAVLPVANPDAQWQFANLDVTGDGMVDADDLQAALEREVLPGVPSGTE